MATINTRAIYFDMDGTIAALYEVEGWLDYLNDSDVYPYLAAKPMLNMSALARRLNQLQRQGYHIGIISCTSKNGTAEYNEAIEAAKMAWLEKHLHSVHFDEYCIIDYADSKRESAAFPGGILFDDEPRHRKEWHKGDGLAFDASNILEILKALR